MKHDGVNGPCTVHEPANDDTVMTYAVIGSRVASFNHDIASKLQGLMMALDEITELVDGMGNADLQRATETANASLKEASTMLSANRSLTRTSTKSKSEIRDVIKAGADRVGVAIRGVIPDGQIETVIPLLAHGLGLAVDAIAGTGRGRALDLAASRDGARMTLVFATVEAPSKNAGDALALAAFVMTRAGGALRCTPAGLEIQLPVL